MPDKAADEKDSAGEARNGVDGVVKPPAANGLGGDLNSRYDVGKKVHSPALSPGRVPPLASYPPCGTRRMDVVGISSSRAAVEHDTNRILQCTGVHSMHANVHRYRLLHFVIRNF